MWTRFLRPIDDAHGVPDSVLTLTAIILLLRPLDLWWVAPVVIAAACLSLLNPSVRRSPMTWILIALLIAVRIVAVWPLADNHIYLLAYWCLAIGLAIGAAAPAATLAASSRWLLGAAFALAVLWKAGLSADYVRRETRRAVTGVGPAGRTKIWPGIEIDVPTGDGEKKTTPDDVYAAVKATFEAGANGIILSRKYSEMRLDNLRAAGRAVRETVKRA